MSAAHRHVMAKRLAKLDLQGRFLFALSCADRLTPCLEKLRSIRDDLDGAEVKRILERLWDLASTGSIFVAEDELKEMIRRCGASLPEWDEKNYNWAAQAESAVAAVAYCLSVLSDGDAQHAADAAQTTLDSVFLDVKSTLGSAAEKMSVDEICADELMQRELQRQESDLLDLRQPRAIGISLVNDLRQKNTACRVGVAQD